MVERWAAVDVVVPLVPPVRFAPAVRFALAFRARCALDVDPNDRLAELVTVVDADEPGPGSP